MYHITLGWDLLGSESDWPNRSAVISMSLDQYHLVRGSHLTIIFDGHLHKQSYRHGPWWRYSNLVVQNIVSWGRPNGSDIAFPAAVTHMPEALLTITVYARHLLG